MAIFLDVLLLIPFFSSCASIQNDSPEANASKVRSVVVVQEPTAGEDGPTDGDRSEAVDPSPGREPPRETPTTGIPDRDDAPAHSDDGSEAVVVATDPNGVAAGPGVEDAVDTPTGVVAGAAEEEPEPTGAAAGPTGAAPEPTGAAPEPTGAQADAGDGQTGAQARSAGAAEAAAGERSGVPPTTEPKTVARSASGSNATTDVSPMIGEGNRTEPESPPAPIGGENGPSTDQFERPEAGLRFNLNLAEDLNRYHPAPAVGRAPLAIPRLPPVVEASRLQQRRLAHYARTVVIQLKLNDEILDKRVVSQVSHALQGVTGIREEQQSRFFVDVSIDDQGLVNGHAYYAAPLIIFELRDNSAREAPVHRCEVQLPSTLSKLSIDDATINAMRRHLSIIAPSLANSLREDLEQYLVKGVPMRVVFDSTVSPDALDNLTALLRTYGTYVESNPESGADTPGGRTNATMRSFEVPSVLARKLSNDLSNSPYSVDFEQLTGTLSIRYNAYE